MGGGGREYSKRYVVLMDYFAIKISKKGENSINITFSILVEITY